MIEKIGDLADSPDLASMDLVWSHAKWWTWSNYGPDEALPVWWIDPSEFVVRGPYYLVYISLL